MRVMAEISAARYRAGEGEPLVLVHGFTATWRCWMPVSPTSCRASTSSPRRCTATPAARRRRPAPPHSTEEAADHLEKLLDEQGVGEAHFAGNSMGGALSLEMAKRGRAKSVVAISPGGGWRARTPPRASGSSSGSSAQRKAGRAARSTPEADAPARRGARSCCAT